MHYLIGSCFDNRFSTIHLFQTWWFAAFLRWSNMLLTSQQERERGEADGSADAAQRQLSRQWWTKGRQQVFSLCSFHSLWNSDTGLFFLCYHWDRIRFSAVGLNSAFLVLFLSPDGWLFSSRRRYIWQLATTGSRLSNCCCNTVLMCTPKTRGKTARVLLCWVRSSSSSSTDSCVFVLCVSGTWFLFIMPVHMVTTRSLSCWSRYWYLISCFSMVSFFSCYFCLICIYLIC